MGVLPRLKLAFRLPAWCSESVRAPQPLVWIPMGSSLDRLCWSPFPRPLLWVRFDSPVIASVGQRFRTVRSFYPLVWVPLGAPLESPLLATPPRLLP